MKPERLENEQLSRCQQHEIVVWQPKITLCSQFSPAQAGISIENLESALLPEQVYARIWLKYRFVEAAENVHIVDKLQPLAPIKRYAEMTPTEKNRRILRLKNKLLHEFEDQLAPKKIVSEEMYQKGLRVSRGRTKKARGMLTGIESNVDREDDRK